VFVRYDPARRTAWFCRSADRRSSRPAPDQAVAQDTGRGDGPGWTAAHERWQAEHLRHAAGWGDQPDACQPLHEPLPPALAIPGTRGGISGACRELCRRLRHPQPRICGRGSGVDAAGHDQARAYRERSEDHRARRAAGTLRLPGLQLRTASLSEGWPLVSGGESFTEERATSQGASGGDPDPPPMSRLGIRCATG